VRVLGPKAFERGGVDLAKRGGRGKKTILQHEGPGLARMDTQIKGHFGRNIGRGGGWDNAAVEGTVKEKR